VELHPDLKTVIELQQVDLKISDLGAQIDSLPSQIDKLRTELNDFIQAHEDHKRRLAANQKERRELEADVLVIREKISKHKDQLYQVKTNEQYRAMLKEVEGEEENIRKVEDRVLEKMVEAEQLEKQIREAAARLESEKRRVAEETRRLESLRAADAQERDHLQAQRNDLAARLSGQVLDQYERLRQWRGMALAEVRDGFCTGCNVRLRPQVYNEVRASQEVVACESCSRILYYIEPPATGKQEPGDAAGQGHQAVV